VPFSRRCWCRQLIPQQATKEISSRTPFKSLPTELQTRIIGLTILLHENSPSTPHAPDPECHDLAPRHFYRPHAELETHVARISQGLNVSKTFVLQAYCAENILTAVLKINPFEPASSETECYIECGTFEQHPEIEMYVRRLSIHGAELRNCAMRLSFLKKLHDIVLHCPQLVKLTASVEGGGGEDQVRKVVDHAVKKRKREKITLMFVPVTTGRSSGYVE